MEEDSGSSEDEIVSLEEEGDWWMVGEEESTGKQKKKSKKKKKKRKNRVNDTQAEKTIEQEGSEEDEEEEEEEEEYIKMSKEEEKFGGWLLELVLSMLQPGISAETLKMLNWVFVALFGCLLIMIIVGGRARLHAFILLFLSSGLFFSLQWYIYLFKTSASLTTKRNRYLSTASTLAVPKEVSDQSTATTPSENKPADEGEAKKNQ